MMEFSCWKHIFVICYFDFNDSEVGVDSYNDVDDIYDNDDVWMFAYQEMVEIHACHIWRWPE